MDETQFEILIKRCDQQDKKLDQIEQAVSRIDRDMTDDRKGFDQVSLDLSSIKDGVKTIIGTITRLQVKTRDAIQDAVSEAVAPVQESVDTFVEKKVISLTSDKVEKLTLMSKVSKLIKGWNK